MANKAGRKTKLTEREVNDLIYLYKTEKHINGKIKYEEIHLFNKEVVQQGRFPTAAGEDFWRKKNRLGRMMIDKANSIFTNRPSTSEFPNDNIPNFTDFINKYYDDKETLISELIVIERKFYKNCQHRLIFPHFHRNKNPHSYRLFSHFRRDYSSFFLFFKPIGLPFNIEGNGVVKKTI